MRTALGYSFNFDVTLSAACNTISSFIAIENAFDSALTRYVNNTNITTISSMTSTISCDAGKGKNIMDVSFNASPVDLTSGDALLAQLGTNGVLIGLIANALTYVYPTILVTGGYGKSGFLYDKVTFGIGIALGAGFLFVILPVLWCLRRRHKQREIEDSVKV